jgi:hypothetical protein
VVKRWATGQEALLARGEFRDPRLGEIKIGTRYGRVTRSRGIEDVTKDKNASLWRTHCEEQWGAWPMAAVARLEAQAWVDKLATTRRARHQGKPADTGDESVPLLSASTIRDIVYLTSGIQHRPADWEVMVPSRL